jgi:hypothetical protein
MALEIMDRRLLCNENPPRQSPRLRLESDPDTFKSRRSRRHRVAHIYLHDAESLCWVYLWTLLSRIPHHPSQTLGSDIFNNTGIASTSRRRLFLDGLDAEEVEQFHPTVHNLAELWDSARAALLAALRRPLDARPDCLYAEIYESLYTLFMWSSGNADVPDLTVAHVSPPTAPPSALQCHSRGPADDENHVHSKDESKDLGVEAVQLGRRSAAYVLVPTVPMKKKRYY